MCGICGIATLAPVATGVFESAIARMLKAIAHRGPDGMGTYIGERVSLGHARLSIIDLSSNAGQPMSNEDSSIWMVYNGEVYNFRELRSKLCKTHQFKSNSDTEAIIHLYEEEGINCINKLRGMFAFCIFDMKNDSIYIVRDRLGQKPLYFYFDNRQLVFASEIKGILASGMVDANPDFKAIYQYLHLGYVPSPRTGFENIKKLQPGHYLKLSNCGIEDKTYWEPKNQAIGDYCFDQNETKVKILRLLEESIKIRQVADVPIGVLLSGGIDSSAVIAMMDHAKEGVKSFTIGFDNSAYDEREYARTMASRAGTEHHEMVVKPDMSDFLKIVVDGYDEPFADPSAIPSYYIAKMVSSHVKVVLNGDGGDENFGGYGAYIQGIVRGYISGVPSGFSKKLQRLLVRRSKGKARSFAEVFDLHGMPRSQFFSNIRGIARNDLIKMLLRPEFINSVNTFEPLLHLQKCYEENDNGDVVNTMLYVDRRTFLPDCLLFKMDIASMRHGVEARSPFLDHRLVEYASTIPGYKKIQYLKKKFLLKQALKNVLPNEILKRPKRGFDVPIGPWIRNELREFSQDLFRQPSSLSKVLNARVFEALLQEHIEGREDYGKLIWALMILKAWWMKHFER